MAQYNKSSPYSETSQSNGYLDVMNWRKVPVQSDDIVFTVTKSYEHRPDLLAYDLYQDSKLWWVFASRNPAILKDPIYDLVAGTKIYLPKLSAMRDIMGI